MSTTRLNPNTGSQIRFDPTAPHNPNLKRTGNRWEVQPTGIASLDLANVQAAVDHGGIVLLKAGVFNFGDDTTGRHSLTIKRGTTIKGETGTDRSGTTWATVVSGGGENLPSFAFGLPIASGAFKVMNFGPMPPDGLAPGDNLPVIFEGLSFVGWAGEAILTEACRGLEVRNCHFAKAGRAATIFDCQVVHAYLAAGPFCSGHLRIEDNKCEFGCSQPASCLPDDENFGATLGTNFGTIIVSRNIVFGHDDGFEILANAFPAVGATPVQHTSIIIENNQVNLTELVGEKWGGHAGIICAGNQNTDSLAISKNQVKTTGPGLAYCLTGYNFEFKENHAILEPLDPSNPQSYPVGGLSMGFNVPYPNLPDLGTSLWDSQIHHNKFCGTAGYGMMTSDINMLLPPGSPPQFPWNESHKITGYANDCQMLRVTGVHLLLTPRTYENEFCGRGCETALDLGTNNQITGYSKGSGPPPPSASLSMQRLAQRIGLKLRAARFEMR